ncbi:jg21042 [Pararge aegeria aegeria]|uniref:Jg21042 protein n=1 Tax=Pararge aegeria aegeria TaxID=348720 RepID=A0A8S4RTS7_9NEOP|nr:jg21042 [Pararge aegeria aegeria]
MDSADDPYVQRGANGSRAQSGCYQEYITAASLRARTLASLFLTLHDRFPAPLSLPRRASFHRASEAQ